jgi:hypothetical protein
MEIQYIFVPKNPILRHCSDSFSNALNYQSNQSTKVYLLEKVDYKTIWHLTSRLVNARSDQRFSFFFLAVQSDYLVLLEWLNLVTRLLNKNLRTYYLMHEPWLKKGQAHFIKSWIIFLHQFLFAYFADIVFLPSDEAIAKATFVRKEKIRKINLAFLSVPSATLEKNLQQLKCSWNTCKTFSMLGTVSSLTKNPQGFSDFATLFNQRCPDKAQFIRGGRDRGIDMQYSEEVIRFPCYLSDHTKSFLFNLSHFIVVPYSISTQSGVVIEALGYGKNLILNDIPAFQDFKNLDFIFMVKFSDKDSIIQCIDRISNMSFEEYENRYWLAVEYFQQRHSESYLLENIMTVL